MPRFTSHAFEPAAWLLDALGAAAVPPLRPLLCSALWGTATVSDGLSAPAAQPPSFAVLPTKYRAGDTMRPIKSFLFCNHSVGCHAQMHNLSTSGLVAHARANSNEGAEQVGLGLKWTLTVS